MTTISLERGVLDLDAGVLTAEDGRVALTDTERRLVAFLAARPGVAVSREALQEAVWGYRPGILSRTVFTTVGRVRAKLERDPSAPRHLVTVPGEGYALHVDAAAPARADAPLPRPVGALVGRDGELATLRAALRGGARVLTLHGPGGVGKTRLALELAAEVEGAAFVPLEGRTSAAELPSALAEGLGVDPGPDPLAAVVADVGAGRRLVVLDNCEHLLPGAAVFVERLVAACPGVVVVATSRRRLGLRGEHLLPLDDLGLPADGPGVAASDAGRLLLDAAGRARLGWSPTPDELAPLAVVCRRVGGSPLALELAASWLRLLSPAELAAELARGDDVLVADDADRPARHRSVAAALAASWRLLDGAAVDALERLAVFSGPFDRALAEAVSGAGLMVLGQLVDAAMLRRGPHGFDLHPLVRRDARQRLAARPDGDEDARARHADAVLARVRASPRPFEAARALRAEVLTVWRRVARRTDALAAHAALLLPCLDAVLSAGELIEVLGEAADAVDAPAWAAALRLMRVGAGGPVPDDLQGTLEAARSLGGPVAVLAGAHAAIASHPAGRLEDGLRWAEQAAALADADGMAPALRLFPRGVAGSLLLRLGRLDAARATLEEAVALYAPGTGRWRAAVHLGQVLHAQGEVERARDVLSEAIVALRGLGDVAFVVMALTSLASAEAAAGLDPAPLLGEAVDEAARGGLPPAWTAGARAQLAALALDRGDPDAAAAHVAGVERVWLAFPADRVAFDRVVAALT